MVRHTTLALFSLLPAALGAELVSAPPVSAQEGTIAFTHSVKLDPEVVEEMRSRAQTRGRRGGGAGRPGVTRELPTETVRDMLLLFDGSASLMKPVPDARGREGGGADRARANFRRRLERGGGGGATRDRLVGAHVDYAAGTLVESRSFLGRDFLVEDERPALAWRLTAEQADFLGYAVQKATAEHDGSTVEAWFTPEIPVPAGPGPYGGLPGMILVVSVDEGRIQYTATQVSLSEIDDGVIAAPTEGESVTRDRYDEIVAEKLEELRRTRGGIR